MRNTLKVIKKIKNFRQEELEDFIVSNFGMTYRAFKEQCYKGTMPYFRIKKLLKLLDITFEELKGYQYLGVKSVKPNIIKKPKKVKVQEKPEKLSSLFK